MKTNIHSPIVAKKSNDELMDLVNNERMGDDIRLAVIWEMQERNLTDAIPEGLEAAIYSNIEKRALELSEQIQEMHTEDIHIVPKIKWGINFLYANAGLQLLSFFIIIRAFEVDYNKMTPQILGMFLVVAGIIIMNMYLRQGKKWPRVVILIWLIMGLLVSVRYVQSALSIYAILPNLGIFQFIILGLDAIFRVAAVVCLFSREANQFYNGISDKITGVLDQV